MKPGSLLILFLGVFTAGATAQSLTPVDLARVKRVDDRINALYATRSGSPAPINLRHNPFLIGSALPPETRTPTGSVEPMSDDELLRRAAATLRVSGFLEVGGRKRLSINTANYAVGDVIPVRLTSGPVVLRVTDITTRSVTLQLNAAEFILSF